jgi:tetratricopeptide (TPR) repeat protein
MIPTLLILLLSVLPNGNPPAENIGRIEIPGVKGVFEINVGDSAWYGDFAPEDKWAMLSAHQRPDRMRISAILREVPFAASPESCKSEFWPKMEQALSGRIQDLIKPESSQVEYTFNGTQNTASRHLLAYWGTRDLCAEVHLSKTGFGPSDHAAFERVLASVSLRPDASGLQMGRGSESSSSLMAQGNEMYAQSNYASALSFYERAFGLEQQNRTFDQPAFVELISRIGFCERLNGDLSGAEKALQYGISLDSRNPLFHYGMACVYAQSGKLDESLVQLEQAYRNKDEAAPGQLPPNPGDDSCFQEFFHNPKFIETLHRILSP